MPCNFIKKRLWHRCFPLNFANSKEHFRAAASQCFTHIESSKLMYKTNQWTGFYAGETLFEHDWNWQGYTVKYFFQSISWNTYFTIVSLCKLPRNVHYILFEAFHEIWKFWKSIFRIFSIVKDFPIEFVFMLINSFVINDVYKNLKENVNIKVKSKHRKGCNFDAITRFQAC